MLAVQGRLLKRAAEIAGGFAALCTRLAVSEHSMTLWMEGKARIPDSVFLSVTDLILNDDVARAAQDRRREPRPAAVDEPAPQGGRANA